MTVTLDMQRFDAALKRYVALNRRDLPSLVNKRMEKVLWGAFKRTPKASAAEIERKFTGHCRYQIVHGYLRMKGRAIPRSRESFARLTERIRRQRLQAIGTLRRGWFGAIRAFGSLRGERKTPRHPGRGLRAQPGDKPAAEAMYEVTVHGRLDSRIQAAAAAALEEQRQDMLPYIARKLGQNWGTW